MKQRVIAIAGPTASGKTNMAISLAKQIGGEIVSADSRLVYKGFNIASAKPTIEEMQGIQHYLIDIVEPEFDYTVADFYDDAKIAISEIISKGKIPIIVGGTGLYFKVLLENYNLPRVEANPDLRIELEQLSTANLLEQLKNMDEKTYENLKNSNKRRIVRALEIIKISGQKLSDMQREKESEYEIEWLAPKMYSRQELYNKINMRVELMYKKGIVEETQKLLKKHGRIRNIIDTIGYKEILTFLDGEATLNEALEKLKQHSRNYAKRQLTWFRKNPQLEQYMNI